jgi:transposase-like protein
MRRPQAPPARACPRVAVARFDGPSQAQPRPRAIVRHGFVKSRHGARLRLRCRTCNRTFCNRRGTAYYRLQHPRRTFDQFAALVTEGLSPSALTSALGVSTGTVYRWLARASKHADAFSEEHDNIEAPLELQFDGLCSRPAYEHGGQWIFSGIEVWSRFWVAAHVGRRNRRSTRKFVLRARKSCGDLRNSVLITSDPSLFYEREIQWTFGEACVYVQVENRYVQKCVVRSTPRLVLGPEWKLEALQAQSEDSKRLNTAYIERLNLFLCRRCSYLHRKTSGRVRNPHRLAMRVELLRCHYNYIKPHLSLRFGTVTRTPAMQAKIFSKALSWRAVDQPCIRSVSTDSRTSPSHHPRSSHRLVPWRGLQRGIRSRGLRHHNHVRPQRPHRHERQERAHDRRPDPRAGAAIRGKRREVLVVVTNVVDERAPARFQHAREFGDGLRAIHGGIQIVNRRA